MAVKTTRYLVQVDYTQTRTINISQKDINGQLFVTLTLCTPMSNVTRHQFLSQELLCRVPLDVLSVPAFFVKRAKEKQDCILEIVSRYIIHSKITKYNNSVNKTGI